MILVTGAGGFIGSNVVKLLIAKGQKVRAFIRYTSRGSTGMLRFLNRLDKDKIDVFYGDMLDFHSVKRALLGVTDIVHLSARISVPYSYVAPEDTVINNVLGTLNMLRAAREANVTNIVYISSSEVYGTALETPILETTAKRAQSPYAASKIATDEIVRSYNLSFGMHIKTVRPFNTYGPGQSLRAVVPWVIYQTLKKDFIEIGNLEPMRDFVFVEDTARAIVQALLKKSDTGFEVNIATGEAHTVREVIDTIRNISGIRKEIRQVENRKRPAMSEVKILLGSSRLAEELIGFKPEVSFEDGLSKTYNWFKEHIEQIEEAAYI